MSLFGQAAAKPPAKGDFMTRFSHSILGTAALMCVSSTAWAQQKSFDVPAQPAVTAITALGRQADVQIIAARKFTRGKMANAVRGAMTVDKALSIMLAGTGLAARKTGPQTYMVMVAARTASLAEPVAGGPYVAGPDDAGDAEDTGADIIVTASKRSERLKNVASAVTALSGQTLLQRGATKLEDYAATIPGFTVQNVAGAGALNKMTIRGITTGIGGNPTVGFYVDDAPFGASGGIASSALTPDLDPADIERIEILRGPQGTLYGAGSMGGLVKFVTKSPSTDGISGRVQAEIVSTDGGSTGYGLRGSVNIPISETVAIRVNGYSREDPGFIDDPVHNRSNVNTNKFAGGRASLLWKLDDATSVRLSATIQHQDYDGTGTIDVNSRTFVPLAGDLQHSRAPGAESLDTTLKLYDARITHDFGWAELMSSSSWGRNRFSTNTDFSPRMAGILAAFFGVTGGGRLLTVNNLSKFTQEFRLTSPSEGRVFWQAGLLYTSERAFAAQGLTPIDTTTGAVIPLPDILYTGIDSTYREIAAFATVGYRFTDRFDISVGGRISKNKQRADQASTGILSSSPGGVSRSSDSSVTFLVNPRYRISDSLMVYGRIASGYRPGGPNLDGPPFEPDTLVNYELGVKADLFDKALSVDLSAFLIDWKNLQLGLIGPDGLGYFGNAARAKSKGIEASGVLRPIRGLQIAGNITYLDAYLAETLTAPLTAVGARGDQLPSSPHWAGSLNADYDFDLGGDWGGFVGASWRYTGKRQGEFATIFSFGVPRPTLPSYDAIDLRAGIHYRQWALSAYAKNIADKRGYTGSFAQGNVTAVSLTQPRTFGLTLGKQF